MLERLKSLPLTIFLTILIWMYAESQVRLQNDDLTPKPGAVINQILPPATAPASQPTR
jgi:hypothetical protein